MMQYADVLYKISRERYRQLELYEQGLLMRNELPGWFIREDIITYQPYH